MPFLFAVAQQGGLVAASNMRAGEWVLAFLENMYVVASRVGAQAAVKEVADKD